MIVTHHPDVRMERLTSDGGAGVNRIISHIDGEDLRPDDRETAAHALGEFLRRLIVPGDVGATARKFVVFAQIFSPELLGVSLSKIGKKLGVTRSALSKVSLELRDQFRLTCRGAKSPHTRAAYRAAQLRAVARGSHASMKRLDRRPWRKR